MNKKPKCCGDCKHCKKVNPEEDRCLVDNHVFDDTLSILIARRDKDCPLDKKKPSNQPEWCAWITRRFGKVR